MAKKTYKMTTVEILDTFLPILSISWVLVFSYISSFIRSGLLAMITVMPLFFIYGLYCIGSAIYVYKELEILKELGKDTYELEKRYRRKKPELNKAKLIVGGCSILAGILLCIVL